MKRIRNWLEWTQRILPQADRGALVLAYHLVGGGTESPVDLPEGEFRRQVELLRASCDVRSLDDVTSGKAEGRGRRPTVVLTFDDAYSNFKSVAWPILAEHRLPVTLYVPVGFVAGRSPCPIRGATLGACTWQDLKALVVEGVTIGSHTTSHVNLARAAEPIVERELADSRTELEQRLGVPVTSFCYPQAKWNRRVLRRVRAHYESGVIAGGRRFVYGRDDPHRIRRFPVRRDLGSFEAMLAAAIWIPEAVADAIRQRLP